MYNDLFAGIALKNLKTLAQFFRVLIHVHPYHLLQQTTRNSFKALDIVS